MSATPRGACSVFDGLHSFRFARSGLAMTGRLLRPHLSPTPKAAAASSPHTYPQLSQGSRQVACP
eukprot:scaffold21795_cov18-Tisochrysis_lutea.AAC.3